MNLAYIDDVMDRAIAQESETPTLHDTDRQKAKAKARKVVAGFHIADEAAEKAALDEMIAARRKVLEEFRTDRDEIRASLKEKGITPLAVIPSTAWLALCQEAKLIRLKPDSEGTVRLHREAVLAHKTAEKFEKEGKYNWDNLMYRLFPNCQEAEDTRFSYRATLVMPQPPADVQDTLLKAQNFPLKVATVPSAIGFKETLTQIFQGAKAKLEAEIAYKEWLRTDPIVYTVHKSATAIIAQFGDFPIEKALVDKVAKSEKLIPERPADLATAASLYGGAGYITTLNTGYINPINGYAQQMVGIAQSQYGWSTATGVVANSAPVVMSANWTGSHL